MRKILYLSLNCRLTADPYGTHNNVCIYFIFLETRIIAYLHSNFSGGLQKTISFLQEWRFGRSRTKVTQGHWFWCQSKAPMAHGTS